MREAQLMIVTGGMGVGKSFTTGALLREYVKMCKKNGRKVLIFDPNNEDLYYEFPTVHFDIMEVMQARAKEVKENTRIVTQSERNIMNLEKGQARRVAPFTVYGDKMSPLQMKQTMITLCDRFGNGLLLLEDCNKYISNFQKEEIQGQFKAIRHSSQDIIMHMQSISPLRPIHFEACRVVRMHYDGFDVKKIRDRLSSDYEILKIAQLIVCDEYLDKGNKRFFLYVHIKEKKIKGITEEQFERACVKYLVTHPEHKALATEIAHGNARVKPSYADIELAMKQWIEQQKYYIH